MSYILHVISHQIINILDSKISN